MKQSVFKTFIVGGGRGCSSLLPILVNEKSLKIVGVCDKKKNAPGINLAKEMGIPTTLGFKNFIKRHPVDLIIDVTGSPEVSKALESLKKPGIEMLGGLSAKLLWGLVSERRKREEEMEQSISEQEALYNIGVLLISAKGTEAVFRRIVQCAIQLSKCKAGSFALYDQKKHEFKMEVAIGFSRAFSKMKKWKLRKKGLTEHILSKKKPTIISDISQNPHINNNSILLKEGIKSLIAVPLTLDGRIIGILYVYDFKPNRFSPKITSLLSLLATQATFALEKNMLLVRAEHLAITDELTQLYNHRYFVHALDKEINRFKRQRHPLCFLMMDIDHFKYYNDTHGHQSGNVVLKTVSKLMLENIREMDILARYGGEEFSLILPGAEYKEGKDIAERIRKAVENQNFPFGDRQPGGKLTISIGLASYPKGTTDSTELVGEADDALYKAKRSGRNKVVVFTKKK